MTTYTHPRRSRRRGQPQAQYQARPAPPYTNTPGQQTPYPPGSPGPAASSMPGQQTPYPPGWTANGTTPHPGQTSYPYRHPVAPKGRNASVTYFLWRFSDVQMIDALADYWMRSVRSQTLALYFVAFLTMTVITGILTYFFDIRPSLAFAGYVGRNAFDGALPFLAGPNGATLTTIFIAILSVMPNLLEFFTVGLALQGNLAMDLSVKAALVFDAITDAPGVYEFGRTVVAYFTTGLPASLSPGIPIVEILFTAPVLLLATIVIETLFLSFILTTYRLGRASFQLRRNPFPRPSP